MEKLQFIGATIAFFAAGTLMVLYENFRIKAGRPILNGLFRIGGHPAGDGDRLIGAVVEHEHDLELAIAGVLDVVAIALRHVADIACGEFVGARAAMGAEHGHARAAPDIVLPLGGVRVPMQFAHAARLDDQQRSGHGRGDRELVGRDAPQGAAGESLGLGGKQAVAMGERRLVERAGRGIGGSGGGTGPVAM